MPLRTGGAVAVEGLPQLMRALRRAEGEAPKLLRQGLRDIARGVRDDARGGVTHTTGRHGSGPRLSGSIKTSVTARGASVYSNAPHAFVQDVGGRVGRNHATILPRASASQYMTKATRGAGPKIERQMEQLLDTLGQDFDH